MWGWRVPKHRGSRDQVVRRRGCKVVVEFCEIRRLPAYTTGDSESTVDYVTFVRLFRSSPYTSVFNDPNTFVLPLSYKTFGTSSSSLSSSSTIIIAILSASLQTTSESNLLLRQITIPIFLIPYGRCETGL
jgi:hypothetical protein